MLRTRADAIVTIRAASGDPRRVLRIAHTFSRRLGSVPEVLAGLLDRHPDLRFPCHQSSATDAVIPARRRGARLRRRGRPQRGGAAAVHGALLLAVPTGDPLTGHKTVHLREAKDRSFVATTPGACSRAHLIGAWPVAGFVPRVTVPGSNPFVVESMVGLGVSAAPGRMADHDHPHVVRNPIADEGCHRTIFPAHRKKSAIALMVRALTSVAVARGSG
ncbi:LysR substrate-binding domain-containing protein [Amycolatopsis sp. NPDC023774]|uniref:LysR substrate-binding domain-containing protein n=1 Tax=Amycolatopsis sp. NPDC023774 TaxID=3155015 RepID=UPI003406EEDA